MLRACKNDGGGRAASHRFPSDRVATCRGCTVMPRTARVGASPPTAARSQELEAGARRRMGVGGGVHGAMELGAQGARCGFSPELEGLQCLSLRTSLSLVQGRAWPGNARLSNRSASSCTRCGIAWCHRRPLRCSAWPCLHAGRWFYFTACP